MADSTLDVQVCEESGKFVVQFMSDTNEGNVGCLVQWLRLDIDSKF